MNSLIAKSSLTFNRKRFVYRSLHEILIRQTNTTITGKIAPIITIEANQVRYHAYLRERSIYVCELTHTQTNMETWKQKNKAITYVKIKKTESTLLLPCIRIKKTQ